MYADHGFKAAAARLAGVDAYAVTAADCPVGIPYH